MRDDNYSMLEALMNRLCEEVPAELERAGEAHYTPSSPKLYIVGSPCICDWRWNQRPNEELEISIGNMPYPEQARRLEECVRDALRVIPPVPYLRPSL